MNYLFLYLWSYFVYIKFLNSDYLQLLHKIFYLLQLSNSFEIPALLFLSELFYEVCYQVLWKLEEDFKVIWKVSTTQYQLCAHSVIFIWEALIRHENRFENSFCSREHLRFCLIILSYVGTSLKFLFLFFSQITYNKIRINHMLSFIRKNCSFWFNVYSFPVSSQLLFNLFSSLLINKYLDKNII